MQTLARGRGCDFLAGEHTRHRSSFPTCQAFGDTYALLAGPWPERGLVSWWLLWGALGSPVSCGNWGKTGQCLKEEMKLISGPEGEPEAGLGLGPSVVSGCLGQG